MLNALLKRLIRGADLDAEETTAAFGEIMDGQATPAQIAAFLIALRIKGETVEEISGAALAMRQRMTPIVVDREPLIDTCGTGGDGKATFNASTAAAFVAAGAGATRFSPDATDASSVTKFSFSIGTGIYRLRPSSTRPHRRRSSISCASTRSTVASRT